MSSLDTTSSNSLASDCVAGTSKDTVSIPDPECSQSKRKKGNQLLESYMVRTTSKQKTSLDEQVARFIFATNTSFRSVEHPEFIQLVNQLRPGYKPPDRKEVSGILLDKIYEDERKKCCSVLKNQTVCLGLDGWSNVHNEPIVCITITTKDGDAYLVDTIDTSGHAHTAEYLAETAANSLKKCEENFECHIRSVVTDNAANVSKMRELLENGGYNENLNVITYGCSAHILNLLANAVKYPNVNEQVIQVIKYFRNNHFANGCYRSFSTTKLVLPTEVRWNSIYDSLEAYVKNWPILVQICEQNRDGIDNRIQNIVTNIGVKRNLEDMLNQLKPIANALDKVQKNDCSISDCVHIWKTLGKELEELHNRELMKNYKSRYIMALTPAHFLAYMLDPKEKNSSYKLTQEEVNTALDFAKTKYTDSFVCLIVKFQAKSSPFQELFFDESVTSHVTVYEWWKSQEKDIEKFNPTVFQGIEQLLTAKASSASVERVFSSFGLVHSKLRNRLGTEKASKLVFLFKILNK